MKHFNALLEVQKGELTVAGLDAKSEANVWKLRRQVGMVFQNPDNQFVSSVVAEDVAFGLENYGVDGSEIPERVSAALALVGMAGFERRSPHMLSGGQKQRVALAGVLAMDPDILVFDEVTSMLDPDGRREVLSVIKRLHSQQGKTIVMITHYVEEAVLPTACTSCTTGVCSPTAPPARCSPILSFCAGPVSLRPHRSECTMTLRQPALSFRTVLSQMKSSRRSYAD